MKKGFLVFVLLVSTGAWVSCGVSPLLNHDSPNREPQSEADPSNQDSSDPSGERSSCDFQFNSQNLCASLVWVRQASAEAAGEFLLRFWSKDQVGNSSMVLSDPNAASVFVKLWMPDMGHGSSPVTTRPATQANGGREVGVFQSTGVFFVMGGKWEIIVQLKDQSGAVQDSAKMVFHVNH